jgi:hypothetical protein
MTCLRLSLDQALAATHIAGGEDILDVSLASNPSIARCARSAISSLVRPA